MTEQDGHPLFARSYPRSAELDRVLAAFEKGDYATVRAEAPQIAAATSDPEVAAAARDLRRRTLPDPLALYLMALTLALLAALSVWAYLHQG